MSNCKPAKISISPEIANSPTFYKNKIDKNIIILNQSAIKALILPVIHICQDLVYSLEILSQFWNNSKSAYVELIKHIL